MSQIKKIQRQQLLAIVIAWQLVALFITTYDYFVSHSDYISAIAKEYSFTSTLLFNCGGALLAALTGGQFITRYVNVRFVDRPYASIILAVSAVFVAVMGLLIVALGFLYVPLVKGTALHDAGFRQAYGDYITDDYHLKNILIWAVVVALTQFILQVNSKFGHGILWDIVRGKYHLPREETRIFMFVDLNSSTAMAERLGDKQYHELLKDFFADITNPIIDNKGEIYQYVGDEVVIAWKYESGIQNNQCVKCFFDIKEKIEQNRAKYMRQYGEVPLFKAGLHFGKVIAGEIGIVKRDITFSGDVLNTTSRIQGKCKEFAVDMIASDDLLSKLSFANLYVARKLGAIQLRGKEKEVGLSTLIISI